MVLTLNDGDDVSAEEPGGEGSRDGGTYTSYPVVKVTVTRRPDGGSTTQHTNLPRKLKLKKGCGQRKNKRDKAGRALHVQLLPYGHQPTVSLAG